jgi:hypothetical protein
MSDQTERARQEYEIVRGIVVATYDGLTRVRKDDGTIVGYKTKGPASALAVGTEVGVVALRGTDQAVYLVDRGTGQRFNLTIWHDHARPSTMGASAVKILGMLLLLVPFLGQFAAFCGGIGAIVGGLAASSAIKGHGRISVSRILIALGVYFFGSFLFFTGWFGHNSGRSWFGFLILAVGAWAYGFWTQQPAIQYKRTVIAMLDEAAA